MVKSFKCNGYCRKITGIDCMWFNNFSSTIAEILAGSYYFFFGTGSYPWVPQGWQRAIRFIPSQVPFTTPHSRIASMVY